MYTINESLDVCDKCSNVLLIRGEYDFTRICCISLYLCKLPTRNHRNSNLNYLYKYHPKSIVDKIKEQAILKFNQLKKT